MAQSLRTARALELSSGTLFSQMLWSPGLAQDSDCLTEYILTMYRTIVMCVALYLVYMVEFGMMIIPVTYNITLWDW